MFGFKQVDHITYKRNFLKTVTFQFFYSDVADFNEKKLAITKLFKPSFPKSEPATGGVVQMSFGANDRTPIVNTMDSEGLILKSEDGKKVLSITQNAFTLTINGLVYENFNTLESCITNLNDCLDLLNLETILRLSIRKFNVAEFKSDGNPMEIMGLIINPDLTGNMNYLPNSENIRNNIQTINYQINNNILNIRYGLNMLRNVEEIGQVIFDIDLIQHESIEKAKVLDYARSANNEIFNVFNWIISDSTKEYLNNED